MTAAAPRDPDLTAAQVNALLLERIGVRGVIDAASIAVQAPANVERWKGQPIWRGLSEKDHNGPGDSLVINRSTGSWVHFGRPIPAGWRGRKYCSGDLLDLYALFRCAGDRRLAFAWALDKLDLRRLSPAERAAAAAAEKKAKDEADKRRLKAEDELASLRGNAFGLWLKGGVPILGTPSADYVAGRGVDLCLFTRVHQRTGEVLPRPPGALRHGAQVWCKPLRRHVPALLALVTRADRPERLSVHRHFLAQDAAGRWVKHPDLPGREAKTSYCSTAGGIIPIWPGAHDAPLWKQPAGTTVLVTEGVEDGLTAAMAEIHARDAGLRADRPVVAAISLGNLGNVEWPPSVAQVIYVAQNEAKARAEEQREGELARVAARGVAVSFVLPPPGVKDVNDLLKPKLERV